MHRNPTRREFFGSLLALHAGMTAVPGQERPTDPNADNPFLEGNFAPVREEITVEGLRVIGRLPEGLEGMFVRNGPNPQFAPRGRYHWFDGDGMIHGVRLQGGRASYRNRYVRTAGWREENRAGRSLFTGFLEPPDLTRLAQGGQPFKNAANTALVWYHDRLLALWEGGAPHALRLPSLETTGVYDFDNRLNHPFTAHPKVDPATGDIAFFGYGPVRPYLRYGVADRQGRIVHTAALELPRPVMMHDFAITGRYTIFLDLPEVFSLGRAVLGQMPFRFEPQHGARLGVLPRRGSNRDLRWFEIAPCFVFHTFNAWEEDDDTIVLLACRTDRFPEEINGVRRREGENAAEPRLTRWRIDLRQGGRVREERLDDRPIEFPRVAENRLGSATRWGYAGKAGGLFFESLVKYDLANGRAEEHAFGRNRFGGEAVFVPAPDAREENAGWLLTYVFDRAENRSELVIVDARDFRGDPVAQVLLPARVPFGFHGCWVGEAALRSGGRKE